MADKRIGYKTEIAVSVDGTTVSFVAIGCIVDGVSGPESARTKVDTSCLDDTFMTFSVAQTDPGELSFTMAYDPNDASSQTLTDLLTQDTPIPRWQITYPVSASTSEVQPTEEFDAFVIGLGREIAKEELITRAITLAISGDPGFTAST